MSAMDAIKNLFGGQNTTQIQQPLSPQQNQNPNIPSGVANPGAPLSTTHASPQTGNNGIIPAQQDPNANQSDPNLSPLDAFKTVWDTPVNPDPNANKSMFADLDAKKLMESASRVDFTKVITPEQLEAIGKGGEEAVKAYQTSLQNVAQTLYAQSAFATTKIVEQALAKQQEKNDAALPTLMKRFSANENLIQENPLANLPAVKPVVEALQTQFLLKNPNATSAEIQSQVGQFLTALGQTFATKPKETKTQKGAATEDWSKFLE